MHLSARHRQASNLEHTVCSWQHVHTAITSAAFSPDGKVCQIFCAASLGLSVCKSALAASCSYTLHMPQVLLAYAAARCDHMCPLRWDMCTWGVFWAPDAAAMHESLLCFSSLTPRLAMRQLDASAHVFTMGQMLALGAADSNIYLYSTVAAAAATAADFAGPNGYTCDCPRRGMCHGGRAGVVAAAAATAAASGGSSGGGGGGGMAGGGGGGGMVAAAAAAVLAIDFTHDSEYMRRCVSVWKVLKAATSRHGVASNVMNMFHQ